MSGCVPAPSCGGNELRTTAAYEGYEDLQESFLICPASPPEDYYTDEIPADEELDALNSGGVTNHDSVIDPGGPLDPETLLPAPVLAGLAPSQVMYLLTATALELLRKLGVPLSSNLSREFTSMLKPYSPTAEEAVFFRELDARNTPMERIDYLMREHGKFSIDAFDLFVRHALLAPQPNAREAIESGEGIDGLGIEDVKRLRDPDGPYNLTYEQMKARVMVAAAETKRGRMGDALVAIINAAIPAPVFEDEMPVREVDQRQARTQEDARRLQAKLRHNYSNVTVSFLGLIVRELEGRRTFPDRLTLQLGGHELTLDFTSIPAGERREAVGKYLRMIRRIRAEVRRSGYLSDRDVAALEGIVGGFEEIDRFQQFRRLSGISVEEMIEASRRGDQLLAQALSPADQTAADLRRFFLRLSGTQNGTLGFRLPGQSEVNVAVWSLNGANRPNPLQVYDRFNAGVGPYTFHETAVVEIGGGAHQRAEPALLIIDRRGRPAVLTLSEMRRLQAFAGNLERETGGLRDSHEVRQAFWRFFNDLQSAWLSVRWQSPEAQAITAAPESPASVSERARLIRELSPGYELLRVLRQTSRHLLDIRLHNNIPQARYQKLVLEAFSALEILYQPFFPNDNMQTRFRRAVRGMAREVQGGDEKMIRRRGDAVKRLAFQAMDIRAGEHSARYKGNVRTVAFGEEVEQYAKISARERGLSETPQEVRERLVGLRANEGAAPSLDVARRLLFGGRFQDALAEYGRLSTDEDTNVEVRARALAELFRVAYVSGDAVQMHKSVAELACLVDEGHALTLSERRVVEDALFLEEAQVVAVPARLKEAMQEKIGLKLAGQIVREAVVGREASSLPHHVRAELLKGGTKARLSGLITQTLAPDAPLGNTLSDKNFLIELATYTEAEFEELHRESGHAEGTERQRDPLEEYYTKARRIVREDGLDMNAVREHGLVKRVANQHGVADLNPPAAESATIRISGEHPMVGVTAPAEAGRERPATDEEMLREVIRWPWLQRVHNAMQDFSENRRELARGAGRTAGRFTLNFGAGAIPFGVGELARHAVWGGHEQTFMEFAEGYGALTAGGGLGRVLIDGVYNAWDGKPFLNRLPTGQEPSPSLKRGVTKRSVSLFMALAFHELITTGRINIDEMPKTISRLLVASGTTHGGGALLLESSRVRRLAKGLKLVKVVSIAGAPETLGTSLAGAVVASIVEFQILGAMENLERQYVGGRAEDELKDDLAEAIRGNNELMERQRSGEAVPMFEIVRAESDLEMAWMRYEAFRLDEIGRLREELAARIAVIDRDERLDYEKREIQYGMLFSAAMKADRKAAYEHERKVLEREYGAKIARIEHGDGRGIAGSIPMENSEGTISGWDSLTIAFTPKDGLNTAEQMRRSALRRSSREPIKEGLESNLAEIWAQRNDYIDRRNAFWLAEIFKVRKDAIHRGYIAYLDRLGISMDECHTQTASL